jgi:hypothetical protein
MPRDDCSEAVCWLSNWLFAKFMLGCSGRIALMFGSLLWRRFLLLSILLNLAGCGTYRMAGLTDSSEFEPAILEMPYGAMYSPVFVTHIDCRSRGFGWHRRFEIVPGWRVVTLSGNSQMGVSPSPKSYAFYARPGDVYTFEPDERGNSRDWVFVLVNQETGEPIHHFWRRAQWSYWSGTKPDQVLCDELESANKQNHFEPGATSNSTSGNE